MRNLMSFLPVLALFFVTCTPTYVYKESTNPRYCKPDPRARYHCTTPEDCERYFEALCYHARLNNEAQKVNLIDHRGFMFQGKVQGKSVAGKMIFDGSVYDPHQHKWMNNVRLEMPAH
jgi:hypothetical protein